MKSTAKFFALLFMLFSAVPAFCSLTNVYIAQTAQGAGNGADCADAYAVTFFNTSTNWGSGSGQIGPGTTVHLCGTFTGTAGGSMLTAQGGGATGNPITLLFSTGAQLTAPAWGGMGVAAINLNSQSNIIIDGGTACGTTQGGVNSSNSCNGVIQNTANGMGMTYSQTSYAIEAANTTNIEIRNLGIYNLYIHTAEESQSSCSGEVDQTGVAAVHVNNANTVSIHDSDIHDVGWAIPGAVFGEFQFYNNQAYNFDHAIAFGSGSNTNANGPILIHDNHFGAMVNWDVEPANCDHHDYVHFWSQQNSNTGTINNVYFYNNQGDGDPGTGVNCLMFIEQAVNDVYAFNNDLNPSGSSGGHCVGCLGFGTASASPASTMYAFNNSIRAAGLGYSTGTGIYFSQTTTNALINNVIQGQNIAVTFGVGSGDLPTPCSSIGSISGCVLSNAYENLNADGGSYNTFGYHENNTTSRSTWQTGSSYLNGLYGADAGAQILSPLSAFKLNSNGTPQSGSPVIGAGTNLTALCSGNLAPLCFDKAGNQRPSSGNWDIGAYESDPVAPPTGLTAQVQ